ncbi:hypothetical protein ACFXHA_16370 [Nocardia sp. NPDC059240]|uniref:hypothetical protein n=1 Tax=Nocardia sp. NPDC059240 TaxID=3346786 RepID=UPI00368C19C2
MPGELVSEHAYPKEGSTIQFADQRNGWMFGNGIGPAGPWVTHDGGVTWRADNLPTGMRGPLALAVAAGLVTAVVLDGSEGLHVITQGIDTDPWSDTGVTFPDNGPAPSARIVLRADSGWIVAENVSRQSPVRPTPHGARLVGGHWISWQLPCADTGGVKVAATANDILVACDSAGPGLGLPLMRSDESADAYSTAGTAPGESVMEAQGFAANDNGRAVLAAGEDLLVSAQCCEQWTTAYSSPELAHFRDLVLPTLSFGVVMQWTANAGSLLVTNDGGASWTPVSFGD